MPHLKLGWIAVGGDDEQRREALGRLEIIADTYLSVGTPVQAALASLMRIGKEIRAQIMERVSRNLDALHRLVDVRSGCSALPVEGGWYAVVRVPGLLSDEEWALRLLDEEGVYLHPGFFFGFPRDGYLVVSLLAVPADFEAGASTIVHMAGRGS